MWKTRQKMDNLTICAKCGRTVKIKLCVIAPPSSRYAGGHICVFCIDVPISQGNVMRPAEFKFPVGGFGASV